MGHMDRHDNFKSEVIDSPDVRTVYVIKLQIATGFLVKSSWSPRIWLFFYNKTTNFTNNTNVRHLLYKNTYKFSGNLLSSLLL